MKYRETELLDRTDVGASGTKTIDVKVLDPISRIDITFETEILANMRAQPGAAITKIELVDGADVLFSMSGLEAQALNIYDRKVPTMNGPAFCGGNMQLSTFGIDFGRWLYDPELAFDPKQFRNPQLKITFDEDAAYPNADDNYMEVFAHCFDEKVISPVGFLMSKNHYAYEPGGDNQYNYVELPTDYALRQMLIRGYKTKVDPLDVVDEVRLSEDNDKRVVFDIELRRYFYRMMGVWGPIIEHWFEYGSGDTDVYDKWFTPTAFTACANALPQAVDTQIYFDIAMRGGYMNWRASPGMMCYGIVTGYLPNHSIAIPFGVQSELDSWYDVQTKGSVKLRLYSSTEYEDSLVSVILQQLRRY